MMRELVIMITPAGEIWIFADDMPDLSDLVETVGQPAIDDELKALGLEPELNQHLCG